MTDTVRFDFTIDDLIDVAERSLSRSAVIRKMRFNGTAVSALAVALVAFAFVPAAWPLRLAAAAGCAAAAAATYPSLRRSLVASRLRAYWRERLKSEGPFTCEVELTPEGVTTRQFNATTMLPWSSVASVAEVSDGVEITGKKGGLIVVRERAFPTSEAKRRFTERARASLVP